MRLYFSGSIPGLDNAQLIADAYGITLEWLATGKSPKFKKDNTQPNKGAIKVKVFDVALSAGDGCFSEKEPVQYTLTISEEMAEAFELSPYCVGAYIKGDSMSPRINNGDIAIIDRYINNLEDDGVYAFNYGDHCYIKQLQKIGKNIKVKSINPDYESWTIKNGEGFNIVGKLKITIKRS